MANRVRCAIREEIGDANFSNLVDEAQDAARREQMAIILRYVNSSSVLTEHFFGIKSVVNTTSSTLKEVICEMISKHNLPIQKLRAQGYDSASIMSGHSIMDSRLCLYKIFRMHISFIVLLIDCS
ncbi:hypothetical protein LINPERHAP2_LOCUS4590 [Linum perenne]